MKHEFCSNQPIKKDTSSNTTLLLNLNVSCAFGPQWTQKNTTATPPDLGPRPPLNWWLCSTEKTWTMTGFICRSSTFFFYHSCQPESLVLQLLHIPGLEAMWFNEELFSLNTCAFPYSCLVSRSPDSTQPQNTDIFFPILHNANQLPYTSLTFPHLLKCK